ncbi:MAG: ABC transporter substrate-binding protein [Anaerolineae bacterium]|nr:ABC transporter substrate-binding protein [Anaerolineae bacterium]
MKKISMLLLAVMLVSMLGITGVVAPQDEITIDFWNWWGVQREPLMLEIIGQFESEHPGVSVNNVVQGWDRRAEVVLTAMAGGEPPEVMMASRAEIVRFAAEGLIVPITQYVEADGLDLNAFYPSEIETMWWDGELYTLPMPTAGGETSFYVYNKTLFEEAGLDPENPPTTWQDFWAASEALNQRDGNIIGLMGSDLGTNGNAFLSWLYTNNGSLYSDDLRSVTFNSPEGVETLQWMYDYVQHFYDGIETYADFMAQTSGEAADNPMFQNRMAMQFQNVSIFGHLATFAPDMDYGVALRPHNSENPDAVSQGIAPLGFGWGYVIPKGLSPEAEKAAYDFVRRLTYDMGEGVYGGCWFMQEQARPSPLIACNEDPVFYELNPNWDNVKAALESDIALPIVPPQTQIVDFINQYVELAMYGEMSPQEALDAAAEEAQAVLDQYWSSLE